MSERRLHHSLGWLLLLGGIAAGGVLWWRRPNGDDDGGSWEPAAPVAPQPAEWLPVPAPERTPAPDLVAT